MDSITHTIEPKLRALDHHDNDHDDFLDSVFLAVAAADFTTHESPSDPTTYKQFNIHPRRELFRKAMLDELIQLIDTFSAFTPVLARDVKQEQRNDDKIRVIPTKWVWLTKFLATGDFNRLKARMVACEAVGRFMVDNKWSPTIGMDSARLIFVLAALNECELLSLDVSGAYLRGKRRADSANVYLRLPQGLEDVLAHPDCPPSLQQFRTRDRDGQPYLWRCDANLYGLQDAGAVWWACARDWLLSLGFKQSTVDPCVFSLHRSNNLPTPEHHGPIQPPDFCIIGLYVDDTLGAYSSTSIKLWYLKEFETYFKQSPDSGSDHPEFIAIRFTVSDDKKTVRINTPKLWGRLRQRFGDMVLPEVTSPLPYSAMDLLYLPISDSNPILTKEEFDAFGILGVANWGVLACRPAESHAGALLARRARVPTRSYAKCLTHYCAYLLAHKDDCLTYKIDPASPERDLRSLVDSSWGNCPETMRSWFGYCILWCGCAFSWRAKLQPCVALASRDAEAIAAVFAVKATLGFLIMLDELGFSPKSPCPIRVDNKATVDGAHSEKISKESRFMAMRLKWLREMVLHDLIGISHITTGDNIADVFTKILPATLHARFRAILMGTATLAAIYTLYII